MLGLSCQGQESAGCAAVMMVQGPWWLVCEEHAAQWQTKWMTGSTQQDCPGALQTIDIQHHCVWPEVQVQPPIRC